MDTFLQTAGADTIFFFVPKEVPQPKIRMVSSFLQENRKNIFFFLGHIVIIIISYQNYILT